MYTEKRKRAMRRASQQIVNFSSLMRVLRSSSRRCCALRSRLGRYAAGWPLRPTSSTNAIGAASPLRTRVLRMRV